MEVTLSNPDLERFVLEQVKQGAFPSASAMLEEAVARMMMEAEPLSPEDVAAIAEAEAEYERGEFEDFDVVATRLRAKYGAR
jgi:Arc/MetJ-type ribon-helix-helix transcriptional regulator